MGLDLAHPLSPKILVHKLHHHLIIMITTASFYQTTTTTTQHSSKKENKYQYYKILYSVSARSPFKTVKNHNFYHYRHHYFETQFTPSLNGRRFTRGLSKKATQVQPQYCCNLLNTHFNLIIQLNLTNISGFLKSPKKKKHFNLKVQLRQYLNKGATFIGDIDRNKPGAVRIAPVHAHIGGSSRSNDHDAGVARLDDGGGYVNLW